MSEAGRLPGFRAIVERSSDLMVLQAADGRPTYVSPAVRELLGYEPEQFLNQLNGKVVHPDDFLRVVAEFRALQGKPGATARYQYRVFRRDGSTCWLECASTNLLDDPEVEAVVSTYRDVSAHKRAESELVESLNAAAVAQQRLNYLLSATAAVTYTCRPSGDFGATFVSDNVVAMLGYTARQFTDDAAFFADRVHPEDRARIFGELPRMMESGEVAQEYRFLHADGRYRWVHDQATLVRHPNGAPRELIGYWGDITARKEAEAALRRSEETFRSLAENHPTAMLIHRGGKIVRCNAAMVRLMGYSSAEELCTRGPLDLIHPDDRDVIRARIEAIRVAGRGMPMEERALRRDGSVVIAEVESMVLPIDGQPSFLVFARDLTERRALLQRMAVADRLVSVGMLAAGVAHEMNTPLAYVLSNLSVLSEALPALLRGDPANARLRPEDAAQLLRDAQDGAARVAAVVRDLRTLSQADHGELGPTDLGAALATAAKMAGHVLRNRAVLEQTIEPVPPVRAREGRLVQVFLNLLVNAGQAIPEGQSEQHKVRLWARRSTSGRVAVDIEDTGAGIPPEVLPRIFEPFFTTKGAGGGTGLGLAICQGLVQAFGGEIRVKSAPGQGTTVTVLLPEAEPVAAPARPPTPPRSQRASAGKVLVVDDESRFGTSLRLLLAPQYEVQSMTDARDALASLAAGARFDAILCDLTMPGMTGMEFHAELSRLDAQLARRVVFITGGAFTAHTRDFLENSENPCLEKPVSEAELWKVLARVAG